MYLIITIDTEEDQWGQYNRSGNTVKNIHQIPLLQDIFDCYRVRPTYLVSYPVAANAASVNILRGIYHSNRCEIGAHCHPWNTPPHKEQPGAMNSMLSNLPFELQLEKVILLHHQITESLGLEPVSFRAGRFGFNLNVAKALLEANFKIDSSTTPFVNWTDYYGPNFTEALTHCYRININSPLKAGETQQLIELPVTIGFNQTCFNACSMIYEYIRNNNFLRRLKLIGILSRLKLMYKIWLSPEFNNAEEMCLLVKNCIKNKYRFINMTLHSTSLLPGYSPFVRTNNDRNELLKRIQDVLAFIMSQGIKSITLKEIPGII